MLRIVHDAEVIVVGSRFRAISVVLVLLVGLLSACADVDDDTAPDTDTTDEETAEEEPEVDADPIRIGMTWDDTGRLAEVSALYERGYTLAAEHINEDGGILGREVELIKYDDGGDPEQAVALYQRLIERDNVDLLVGPVGSELVLAAAAVADAHQIPMLNIAGASPAIHEQGLDYIFAVLPGSDRYSVGPLALAEEHGYETVATLTLADAFAQSAIAAAEALIEESELELVASEEFPPDATDFTATMSRLRDLDPDVLLLGVQLDNSIEVISQMEQADFRPAMIWGSGGIGAPEFWEMAGELGSHIMGATQWEPIMDAPGIDRFVEGYEDAHGSPPGYHQATGYGALFVYAEALEAVGEVDAQLVADWLRENEAVTAYGRFAVEPDTGVQTGLDVLVVQWIDGAREVVWPDDFRTHEPILPIPGWGDAN